MDNWSDLPQRDREDNIQDFIPKRLLQIWKGKQVYAEKPMTWQNKPQNKRKLFSDKIYPFSDGECTQNLILPLFFAQPDKSSQCN